MPQLSVNEVARLKGVSVRTVYRAVTDGRLPAARVGRAVLISSENAQAWMPMTTKARPQQRADEQLRGTIERITGLKDVAVGRNIAIVFGEESTYRDFLDRLVAEAAMQNASLTIASRTIAEKDIKKLAGREQGSRVEIVDGDTILGEPDVPNPLDLVKELRNRVGQEISNGASQAWQAVEINRLDERLSAEHLQNWAILQQGVTRIMRHLPAISFSILVGNPDPPTLAGFISCYPQCVVLGDRSFAVRAAPLERQTAG